MTSFKPLIIGSNSSTDRSHAFLGHFLLLGWRKLCALALEAAAIRPRELLGDGFLNAFATAAENLSLHEVIQLPQQTGVYRYCDPDCLHGLAVTRG